MSTARTEPTFKDSVRSVLNDPEDWRYVWFHHFINTLILASVVIVVWQELGAPPERWVRTLEVADAVILWLFLFEFLARLWVFRVWIPRAVNLSPGKKFGHWLRAKAAFVLTPWGFIDFLALLPLLAPMFPFLRSLRVLRLLRLFRSVQFFRYASPTRTLGVAIRDNALLFGVSFGFVIASIIVSAGLFFIAEAKANPDVNTMTDTLWWSIVTVSTVGFGDITPVTTGGKVIGAALMLSGMFIIAMFAGVISSTLVGHLLPLRVEQVRMSAISDHIIIAGWTEEVPLLLKEMRRELGDEMPPTLVFAPRERPESLDPEIQYVMGDFRKDREYDKVRLGYARAVIVVADDAGAAAPAVRDASSVLTVFTVRGYEARLGEERTQRLHIVCEILDPENAGHARVAGADEVIETTRLGSSILAHTACNVGVASAMISIVQAGKNNIYSAHLPAALRDAELMTFADVQDRARDQFGVLVIGIVHNEEMTLNPPGEQRVFLADKIVYIGPRTLGK